MSIKQVSVFLENKPGQLSAMTALLAANNIDIRALSLAETEDFGIARGKKSDIVGGTPEQNAAIARDILANKKGPKYDIVTMNAGAAIYIGGKADSIADGISLAKELIASGAAMKKLDEFIALSNK